MLASALANVSRIGLDTAPIIYYIEEHPLYLAVVAPVFAMIDTGSLRAVTSTVAVAEVSVMPLRLNRPDLQSQYLDLLLYKELNLVKQRALTGKELLAVLGNIYVRHNLGAQAAGVQFEDRPPEPQVVCSESLV